MQRALIGTQIVPVGSADPARKSHADGNDHAAGFARHVNHAGFRFVNRTVRTVRRYEGGRPVFDNLNKVGLTEDMQIYL